MIVNTPIFFFPLICASGILTGCVTLAKGTVLVFVNLVVSVVITLFQIRHMSSRILMMNNSPLRELFLRKLRISLISKTRLAKSNGLIHLDTVLNHKHTNHLSHSSSETVPSSFNLISGKQLLKSFNFVDNNDLHSFSACLESSVDITVAFWEIVVLHENIIEVNLPVVVPRLCSSESNPDRIVRRQIANESLQVVPVIVNWVSYNEAFSHTACEIVRQVLQVGAVSRERQVVRNQSLLVIELKTRHSDYSRGGKCKFVHSI